LGECFHSTLASGWGRMIAVRITPDMEMAVLTPWRIFGAMVSRRRPPIWMLIPALPTSLPTGPLSMGACAGWEASDSPPGGAMGRFRQLHGGRSGPAGTLADDPERGTLIRVLQRYSLRMDGLYLYYPHRNVSPALRAVIDTLKI